MARIVELTADERALLVRCFEARVKEWQATIEFNESLPSANQDKCDAGDHRALKLVQDDLARLKATPELTTAQLRLVLKKIDDMYGCWVDSMLWTQAGILANSAEVDELKDKMFETVTAVRVKMNAALRG